jgi:hypothetical protein
MQPMLKLDREVYSAAMRSPMEAALLRVADAIDNTPDFDTRGATLRQLIESDGQGAGRSEDDANGRVADHLERGIGKPRQFHPCVLGVRRCDGTDGHADGEVSTSRTRVTLKRSRQKNL